MKVKVLVAQLCMTLCNLIGPPGSFVHGIFQARILEWVAISFSRDFPDQGLSTSLLHWQADSLLLYYLGSPITIYSYMLSRQIDKA